MRCIANHPGTDGFFRQLEQTSLEKLVSTNPYDAQPKYSWNFKTKNKLTTTHSQQHLQLHARMQSHHRRRTKITITHTHIIVSIDHLIDGRYSDHACGVRGASCRVLGRIPANTVSFIIAGHGESEGCVIEKSPAIACSGAKIAIRLKCY